LAEVALVHAEELASLHAAGGLSRAVAVILQLKVKVM
jgi:hypothetical protein